MQTKKDLILGRIEAEQLLSNMTVTANCAAIAAACKGVNPNSTAGKAAGEWAKYCAENGGK